MTKASLAVFGHIGPEQKRGTMAAPHALAALAALGQPTRLEIFLEKLGGVHWPECPQARFCLHAL